MYGPRALVLWKDVLELRQLFLPRATHRCDEHLGPHRWKSATFFITLLVDTNNNATKTLATNLCSHSPDQFSGSLESTEST